LNAKAESNLILQFQISTLDLRSWPLDQITAYIQVCTDRVPQALRPGPVWQVIRHPFSGFSQIGSQAVTPSLAQVAVQGFSGDTQRREIRMKYAARILNFGHLRSLPGRCG